MKKWYLFLGFLLVSCTARQPRHIIRGTFAEGNYDGQYMYLVPTENANSKTVDSVVISHGEFVFEVDSEYVAILRLPIRLRENNQELLVVTEPGVTQVVIGRDSRAQGTPQNALMQRWKEATLRRNMAFAAWQMARADSLHHAELPRLRASADSANAAFEACTRQMVRKHRSTTLQRFLSKTTGIE